MYFMPVQDSYGRFVPFIEVDDEQSSSSWLGSTISSAEAVSKSYKAYMGYQSYYSTNLGVVYTSIPSAKKYASVTLPVAGAMLELEDVKLLEAGLTVGDSLSSTSATLENVYLSAEFDVSSTYPAMLFNTYVWYTDTLLGTADPSSGIYASPVMLVRP